MKRILTITFILTLICFQHSFAQKCPRNLYDCKGACGWFIDTNHDGYCDYTTFSEALMQKILHKKDSIYNIKKIEQQRINDSIRKTNQVKTIKNSSTQNNEQAVVNSNKKCPFENTSQCNKNQSPEITPNGASKTIADSQPKPTYKIKKYDLFSVFFACIGLYFFTLFLAKINVIKKRNHRKIWNTLLLITFLITGLLGLTMVIQLNYQVFFSWFKTLLYWHVEFGISMAAISILHILWHWKYFINLFKKHRKVKIIHPE